ncbi:MAG: helix-turn-helix transcriptional regulator [Lachnospiraceae bacterium]|nr:helix-turn-helix transcriptional regulator [Lachnospiraceae bacterium]
MEGSMFSQVDFGKRLRLFRKKKNYTQKEVAFRIGVSEQAVSKWENGECLPDVYNLKILGQLLHVSIDTLLATESDKFERVVETIKIGGAEFEIIEKPETILAGKIIYAKDYQDADGFNSAIETITEEEKQAVFNSIREMVLPITDIHLSVNFWLDEKARAFGFVREVITEQQPEGVDVYKMPASLYIRAYTDKGTAQLIAKDTCEIWELFAYIRNFFMPAHGFRMADNGAQELEVFDSFEHRTGYAYMPIMR